MFRKHGRGWCSWSRVSERVGDGVGVGKRERRAGRRQGTCSGPVGGGEDWCLLSEVRAMEGSEQRIDMT